MPQIAPTPHALLLYRSADLRGIELLPHGTPIDDARAAAEQALQGDTTRAVLIQVLGEASQKVEWKEVA